MAANYQKVFFRKILAGLPGDNG